MQPPPHPPSSTPDQQSFAVAFAALLAAAIAMGLSPVLVRLAEVGPFGSAFWRVILSLPVLTIWAMVESRGKGEAGPLPWSTAQIVAGFLFAGDLFFWHLAILRTTVANATFLATMAPIWVLLGSGFFLGERVTRPMVAGLSFCLAGAAILIGTSYGYSPDRLDGDIYGIATSFFFGAYFLAVRIARRTSRPGLVMLRSSQITAAILFACALALEDSLFPASASGAAALVALALISHAAGQGLLAFALGALSAAFSSLVIFLEAIAAAGFGWLILGEALEPLQIVGGAAILAGIWIARPRPR